jgi:hypothetical protein
VSFVGLPGGGTDFFTLVTLSILASFLRGELRGVRKNVEKGSCQ